MMNKSAFTDLYLNVVQEHPSLIRMLVWQDERLAFDRTNPKPKLDLRTRMLRTSVHPLMGFMPTMQATYSDFHGDLKNVRSVTKTICSLLSGMVFKDQLPDFLEIPIRDYFPQIPASDPKADIRIKHLLSNTSGLPTIEDFSSMRRLFTTPNWVDTILSYPLQIHPGEGFVYSSANFHLMQAILEEQLGSSLMEYARKNLFHPLEIFEFYWKQDPQGVPFGGSDLFLSPESMLVIGRMLLNKGNWRGEQIVPEEWLRIATQEIIPVNESDIYGYGWWVNHNKQQGCLSTTSACGVGGQRIILIPSKDVMVVTTSRTSLYTNSSVIDDIICQYFTDQ